MGNIFWAGLFVFWRNESHRLKSENAKLEGRVQYAEKSKDQFTKDVQAAIDSQDMAGIYRYIPNGDRRMGVTSMDLRSDGSGLYKRKFSETFAPVSWTAGGGILKVSSVGVFKIEGEDIIDDKGNRWEKYR